MRPKISARRLGAVAVLSALLFVSPVAAASGGPVLDYLQDVIKPVLDALQRTLGAIQGTVNGTQGSVNAMQGTVNDIQGTVNLTRGTVNAIHDTVDATQDTVNATRSTVNQILSKVNGAPQLSVVHAKFTTTENSDTSFSLDLRAVPSIPFGRVCRYTVALVIFAPSSGVWAPGIDNFQLRDGVYNGTGTADVNVVSFDPAAQRSVLAGPYAGSNSFIVFHRGGDGAGTIDVWVTAYIESEP